MGTPYGDRLLSLVMLNVLDEKWKDHLYDLDQLRNAIHYRSWGQKDPLIEYKQEAYTMFVDLMNDIYNTFSERFLKVQLVFEQPVAPPPPRLEGPKKRYNAHGDSRGHPVRGADASARGHGCGGRHRPGGAAATAAGDGEKGSGHRRRGPAAVVEHTPIRRRTSTGRRWGGTIRARAGLGRIQEVSRSYAVARHA